MTAAIFSILDEKTFLDEIQLSIRRLDKNKTKSIADILFVVFGLNHLREWIAPGYGDKFKASNYTLKPAIPSEVFYQEIWRLPEFKIINTICNGTKHFKYAGNLGAKHELSFDERPSVDDCASWDRGLPSDFTIDDKDALPILKVVADFYQSKWFAKFP